MHLVVIVIFSGSLGGLVDGLATLSYDSSNAKAKKDNVPEYLARPFVGAGLALMLYFAFRAGILTGDVDVLNPYSVAAVVGLAGMGALRLVERVTAIILAGLGKND